MNALQRTIKYPQSIPGDIASALSDLRSGVYDEIMAASAGGICSISVTTMKSMSALKGIILLSDLLTDDKPFYLPTESRQYRIINNWTTTTSKVVTATTRNGNGVVMGPGDIWDVYCDGTDIKPMALVKRARGITFPPITFNCPSTTPVPLAGASGDILSEITGGGFVPKNDGLYQVRAYAMASINLQHIALYIEVNGVNVFSGSRGIVNTAWSEIRSSISTLLTLTKNDVLKIRLSVSAADPALRVQQIDITQVK